jgi:uncharacterized protein
MTKRDITKLFGTLVLLVLISCGQSKETENNNDFIGDDNNENILEEMPIKQDWVNDYEELFSAEEFDTLRNIIIEYEEKTTNEIYLLTVSDINPYSDLTNYSDALFNLWLPGKEEKDNGMIFIISRELGELRIVNGSDFTENFTSEECRYIINDVIIPYFINSEYYEGTKEGIIQTIDIIEQ